MGKPRIIAETGAGQHGVAGATACALLDLECVVYMGSGDIRRQKPNVERMKLLGAEVVPVEAGARTLKEAVSAAIRDWVANVADTHYIIGSAVGPLAFPELVRDLQRVIGDEARDQTLLGRGRAARPRDRRVGGGSNAIGTFTAFIPDEEIELIGVEAAGHGLDTDKHGASLTAGNTSVPTARFGPADRRRRADPRSPFGFGRARLPGTGPEHAHLRDIGRARYVAVDDRDAIVAFRRLSRLEGIIPALESSHAIAWLPAAKIGDADGNYDVLCLSGRGDKGPGRGAGPGGGRMTGAERIAAAFAIAGEEGRAALMPYMMGGFPTGRLQPRSRALCRKRGRPDRTRRALLGPRPMGR